MKNDPDVELLPIETRQCRFPNESMPGSKLKYSISSCITELRIAVEQKLCGRILPSSPLECKLVNIPTYTVGGFS